LGLNQRFCSGKPWCDCLSCATFFTNLLSPSEYVPETVLCSSTENSCMLHNVKYSLCSHTVNYELFGCKPVIFSFSLNSHILVHNGMLWCESWYRIVCTPSTLQTRVCHILCRQPHRRKFSICMFGFLFNVWILEVFWKWDLETF
jgi:hypothetical protein